MDSGCIPVELICIPVDSSGFRQNPVNPAGMVGGVTSTAGVTLFDYSDIGPSATLSCSSSVTVRSLVTKVTKEW